MCVNIHKKSCILLTEAVIKMRESRNSADVKQALGLWNYS